LLVYYEIEELNLRRDTQVPDCRRFDPSVIDPRWFGCDFTASSNHTVQTGCAFEFDRDPSGWVDQAFRTSAENSKGADAPVLEDVVGLELRNGQCGPAAPGPGLVPRPVRPMLHVGQLISRPR
jgi:hypothetical protein